MSPRRPTGDSDAAKRLIPVGYWTDPTNPATRHLPNPKDLVDSNWDLRERTEVSAYLRRGRTCRETLGFSWCRFECGVPDNEMGTCDLTDGTYVWPEGFAHYVEQHLVKPPDHFLTHVRRMLDRGVIDSTASDKT